MQTDLENMPVKQEEELEQSLTEYRVISAKLLQVEKHMTVVSFEQRFEQLKNEQSTANALEEFINIGDKEDTTKLIGDL